MINWAVGQLIGWGRSSFPTVLETFFDLLLHETSRLLVATLSEQIPPTECGARPTGLSFSGISSERHRTGMQGNNRKLKGSSLARSTLISQLFRPKQFKHLALLCVAGPNTRDVQTHTEMSYGLPGPMPPTPILDGLGKGEMK